MISIKSDFVEKQAEANVLIEHISEVSNGQGGVNKTSILKSAFIILLYNMIESTTRSTLERVHEKISRYDYSQQSIKIKKLSIDFYFRNGNGNKHKESLDKVVTNTLFFPSLSDFEKRIRLFSGNLDVQEINNIINRYGIGKIKCENSIKILLVKNKRNKIAHGEDMFKEACRNLTISELNEIKDVTIGVLNQLIELTDRYLSQERYRS